tara:strand:+ start:617 stop:838 length:222 start_codon:yes stop_codon:yes gene_type:complete
MSKYLAYGMLIYTIASIYYMVVTMNIGTPFKDSLTEEQIEIKKQSANVRRNVFYQGVGLSAVLIYLVHPFSDC